MQVRPVTGVQSTNQAELAAASECGCIPRGICMPHLTRQTADCSGQHELCCINARAQSNVLVNIFSSNKVWKGWWCMNTQTKSTSYYFSPRLEQATTHVQYYIILCLKFKYMFIMKGLSQTTTTSTFNPQPVFRPNGRLDSYNYCNYVEVY